MNPITNDADFQALRTASILKAAGYGVARILREHKELDISDEELYDIGCGLEYALEDADKAKLASEKATQDFYEAKLKDLETQIRRQP